MTSSASSGPLPMRWAVILLIACSISVFAGMLTFIETGRWSAALLVALGSGGTAVPTLHQVIGA